MENQIESTLPIDLLYGSKFLQDFPSEMRASDIIQILLNHYPKEFENLLDLALRKERKTAKKDRLVKI